MCNGVQFKRQTPYQCDFCLFPFFQGVELGGLPIFIHTHLRSEQRPSGGTNDRDQADQAGRAGVVEYGQVDEGAGTAGADSDADALGVRALGRGSIGRSVRGAVFRGDRHAASP